MRRLPWTRSLLRAFLFFLSLTPLVLLLWNALNDALSANPIKDITEATGTWTLRFLLITLSITPIQKLTGWSLVATYRRMSGLFAFFYGFLHFVTYVYLDQFLDVAEILRDVTKRPFIAVGFMSFLMMIPLAVTSPTFVTGWMGGRRWKLLHRAVYAVALGGVIHYLWLVKADTSRPLRYGALLALLLLIRVWYYLRARRSRGTREDPGVNSMQNQSKNE